jgi:hypothetical protein
VDSAGPTATDRIRHDADGMRTTSVRKGFL